MNEKTGSSDPVFFPQPCSRPAVLLLLLAGLFAFGLYPFDFLPRNRAIVLPGGFAFAGQSLVTGEVARLPPEHFHLSVGLTPTRGPRRSLARIFTLLGEGGEELLTLNQWKATLEVGGAWTAGRVGVGEALGEGEKARVEVAISGPEGRVRVGNGPEHRFSLRRSPGGGGAGTGILLGDSPSGTNPWWGRMEDLSLGDGAVPRAPTAWQVPPTFRPPAPRVLSLPQGGHRGVNRNLAIDAVVNLFGFVPWGFCVAAALAARGIRPRWSPLLAVGSGFAVSLAIELAQVALPTRTSSLTDLALNTAGTAVGVLILRRVAGDRGARLG